MPVRITSRQCKQARALLKWNLLDLSNKSNVPATDLQRFEDTGFPLAQPMTDQIVKTFNRHHVAFKDPGMVMLLEKKDDKKKHDEHNFQIRAKQKKAVSQLVNEEVAPVLAPHPMNSALKESVPAEVVGTIAEHPAQPAGSDAIALHQSIGETR